MRSAGRDVGVRADEALQAQLEAQLLGAHVALDDLRQHVDRVIATERALQVGELGQHHRRLAIAKRRPVLRHALEHLAGIADAGDRGAAAGRGLVLGALADEHEHSNDDRRQADDRSELQQVLASLLGAQVRALVCFALCTRPRLLCLTAAHVDSFWRGCAPASASRARRSLAISSGGSGAPAGYLARRRPRASMSQTVAVWVLVSGRPDSCGAA